MVSVPLLRASAHDRCGERYANGVPHDGPSAQGFGIGDRRFGGVTACLLKSAGALVVSFSLAPSEVFAKAVATLVVNPPKELDAGFQSMPSGSVTRGSPQMRNGQGLYTAQTQLVAEISCAGQTRVS